MHWGDVHIEGDTVPCDFTLMVLGGRAPCRSWLASFDGRPIVAVDSGVNACRDSGLAPHTLAGDGDSAATDAWQWAVSFGARVHTYNPDKDDTDFQLALSILPPKEPVLLTGCFGGRFDHLWSIVMSFVHGSVQPLGMADETEGMLILQGASRASLAFGRFSKAPKALSLLALDGDCGGVDITGARWQPKNRIVPMNYPYAISNEIIGSVAEISVSSGTLGIYWTWNE